MTIALLIGGNVVSAQEEPAAEADPAEVEATNESRQSDATDSPQVPNRSGGGTRLRAKRIDFRRSLRILSSGYLILTGARHENASTL